MPEQELYRKFANYYDLIYQWMDYEGESEFIKMVVEDYKTSEGMDLLDVACGTGGHAQYLQDSFNIVGLDINHEMLEIAQEKLPGIEFVEGDMKKMDLPHKFDSILCLFSAINYHTTMDELEGTFKRFYEHLKSGGVLIFDLGFCTENWEEGRMLVDAVVQGDLQLARISQSRLYHGVFNANFVFLVKEDGKMDFEIDQHQIGVFPTSEVAKILEKTGFENHIYNGYNDLPWDKKSDERPVFVSIKK
ncbi:class I SAM-dependent DNA methyltransferase [Methanobacterium petrolearium]|uniref:class I SAM-dependent DNA methyltransferase n=1 Tax=Methanobacterium petrolearium TaxID=710190 RepID=UPI001AE2C578|nr:class I SAM-dependent methyltransferase [Methanobacterium petrolearium]MBP1946187.1 ubiquinone/menaquinone biosynthesis C-methylase UbiE [Methanobacterium petrolearium]BDZ70667.1 methyltransferase [Methanobacterium petrolearium]